MGVRLIVSNEEEGDRVALYDSVSGWAFGPVFRTPEDAEAFLAWLPWDARSYSDAHLSRLHGEWLASLEADCDEVIA